MIIATDTEIGDITEKLTKDFTYGGFDLCARSDAPVSGWDGIPEFVAAKELQRCNISLSRLRIFLTLVASLDRARDSNRLWKAATKLYKTSPWIFEPEEIKRTPLLKLRRCLAEAGVSQRHIFDVPLWKLLAEVLICPDAPCAVRNAVWQGEGDAKDLLNALKAKDRTGQPWFPYLSGPKVSVVWIRILAVPGCATIHNLEVVPVGVDEHVRRATENLGITNTRGRSIEKVRHIIQEAWHRGAPRAVGPDILKGTSAAIDPAVWFFGKWGCYFCERSGRKVPISEVCKRCQFK